MSIEQLAIVLHHSKMSGTAKLVMLGVANHDGDGGAYPSHLRLATYAGVADLRNLRRAIDKCIEAEELTVDVQAGGKYNTPNHARSNLYTINVRCPENCDHTPNHRLVCWGCDEPLPFARYTAVADDALGVSRIGWHKRCAESVEPVENVGGGATAPGGASAPGGGAVRPPKPSFNYLTPDIDALSVSNAREAEQVEPVEECLKSDDGVHPFAEHNGKPWRCIACGIHYDEIGAA